MAIELKQSLKLSQQLVITPQLQQAIKLLQLSRVELVDMVQKELTENPVLEEGSRIEDEDVGKDLSKEIEAEAAPDKSHETQAEVGSKDGELKEPKEFDWENYMNSYNDTGESYRPQKPTGDELPSFENVMSQPTTLQDHLEWQLKMAGLTPKEDEIAAIIISELDSNGYLKTPLTEIAEQADCTEDEVIDTLEEIIQGLDPTGVGARDLKECLLLQARVFGDERPLLENIINNYLPLIEKRDYGSLAKKLKIPLKQAIEAAKILSEMEPKPGRPYEKNDTQYITPDVYVYKVGDEYAVVLNDEGLPRLRVSSFYKKMLTSELAGAAQSQTDTSSEKSGSDSKGEARDYVQEKLKGALWLIKSIHQRQRTLYRVSKCIVSFQKEFLDKGIEYLKPMVLKDVAEEIGVHESTVSRATSNKFIHTPQGIHELKFYFSSGVSVTTGQDVAAESVKQKIKQMIAQENKRKPLSDKEIVDRLKQDNIDVARRTVAKYREMLAILPSSKRKRLY